MFSGFMIQDVDVNGVRIHSRVGGKGPPALLLHGYPQTHVIWRKVAAALALSHTVVVSDLRGYGDSGKPASETDHSAYSKRAMAADQVGLMTALGTGVSQSSATTAAPASRIDSASTTPNGSNALLSSTSYPPDMSSRT
jgi:pimeloyl-ACP methyl ester carboxylesterase